MSVTNVDSTIRERHNIHGNYAETARIAQEIKCSIASGPTPPPDDVLSESLDLIATKLARIASGDPRHIDHWHDIAGYARLAEQHLLCASRLLPADAGAV